MRANETALAPHEKAHRTDSRRGGVVHPCFVRGGSGAVVAGHDFAGNLSGVARLDNESAGGLLARHRRGAKESVGVGDSDLLPAGHSDAKGTSGLNNSRQTIFEGEFRATSLFAVFADGDGFGFRAGFAAEATQFLCCFVFHGKVTIPKRLGFASRKMQNLNFSSPNDQVMASEGLPSTPSSAVSGSFGIEPEAGSD